MGVGVGVGPGVGVGAGVTGGGNGLNGVGTNGVPDILRPIKVIVPELARYSGKAYMDDCNGNRHLEFVSDNKDTANPAKVVHIPSLLELTGVYETDIVAIAEPVLVNN